MGRDKKVQIFKDSKKETRVRIVGGNGEKMFTSEGLSSTTYAKKLAENLKKFGGPGTKVEDLTEGKKKGKK